MTPDPLLDDDDHGSPVDEVDGSPCGGGLTPAEVFRAARRGWACPGAIRSAGPDAELGDRLAAYRWGRSRLIAALVGRDGGAYCVWCGCKLNGRLTVEHIVPRGAGGSSEPVNLCLACRPCNEMRAGVDAVAWYLTCRREGMQPRARVLSRRLLELGLVADMAALHRLGTRHLNALSADGGDLDPRIPASSRNSRVMPENPTDSVVAMAG